MRFLISGFRVPWFVLMLLAGPRGRIEIAAAQVPATGGGPAKDTLGAPYGGRAIPLGGTRVACPEKIDLRGWTLEADLRNIRPPATPPSLGNSSSVTLPMASDPSLCKTPTSFVDLIALGSPPMPDAASGVLDVDAGQVIMQGRGLRGALFVWAVGERSGTDICTDPQLAAGVESCVLAIARDLPADPSQISLALLPAGSRVGPRTFMYDANGLLLRPEARGMHPARVLVSQLLRPDATLDLQAGGARLPLSHAEAIGSIDCQDAFCAIDGSELVIRGEHGPNDALEVQFRLRPHVFLRRGNSQEAAPGVDIPLQRCPVALASPPILRGTSEQAIVIRLGGRCAVDTSLIFSGPTGRLYAERSELVGGERYVVLRLERTYTDLVSVTIRRAGTTVGVVAAPTRSAPALQARLKLVGGELIDFIPTNRDAKLIYVGLDAANFMPLAVEGAYTVQPGENGSYLLRGVEGTTGTVALRFAYHDVTLPPALRDLPLAVLVDPLSRSVHVANLPLTLEADAKSDSPLVELLCDDGTGHPRRMRTGVTEQLPFRVRDSCRLVLHRERLRPQDGAQSLQVTAEVTAADGTSRSDAKVDQRLVIRPSIGAEAGADKARTLHLTGVVAPFDRVVVRVSVIADDLHYAMPPDDKLGAQLQWSLVMGTGHFRLYATTAIPTGLYRVADSGHQGILTLNAGAVLRLVWLSKEGRESPIGLETGLMWLGITGDTSPDATAHGEFAVVAGIGLGIPIANQSRASQTSISLHAWFEYEVSRAARPDSGIPYGFVFGPSITVGDLGFNF